MEKIQLKSANSDKFLDVGISGSPQNAGEEFKVSMNGSENSVGIEFTGSNTGIFTLANEKIPFCFHRGKEFTDIWFHGKSYRFETAGTGPKRSGAGQASGSGSGDSGHIRAPMPGKILQVKVAEGDRVEANASLVIMESMKMEMTLSAPMNGVVKKINCQPDQMVEMGSLLLSLAPEISE